MQNYMLTVVIKNSLEEKERTVLLEEVKKKFGNLKKEDLWGARGLAYPIAHLDKAYFAHYEFEAEPASISSLDNLVKLNEDIIRYLLTRVEIRKKIAKVKTNVSKSPETKETLASEGVDEEPKEEKVEETNGNKVLE